MEPNRSNINRSSKNGNGYENEKKKRSLNEKKEWEKFQTHYVFFLISLSLYTLRPIKVNDASGELRSLLEILNLTFTQANYQSQLDRVMNIFHINFNKRANISGSPRKRLLNAIQFLIPGVKSFKDLYEKMKTVSVNVVDNQAFFQFFYELIFKEGANKNKSISTMERLLKHNEEVKITNISKWMPEKKNNANLNNSTAKIQKILKEIAQNIFTQNLSGNGSINVKNRNLSPGNVQPGNVSTGNVSTGNVSTGNVRPGNVKPGNVSTVNVRSGNVSTGNVRSGNVKPGNVRSGNVQPGNVQPGNVSTGNVQPGNVRSRNVQSGNVSTGNGTMNLKNRNVQPSMTGGKSMNDFWWLRKYNKNKR